MQLPFALERPLVFFDLETTGLDLKNDRIIELAFIKVTPLGDVLERERRFNPGIPIPPEATAVHGIRDEDVAHELPFCRTAKSLAQILEDCDLAGFNIRRFDLSMLVQEFKRCGVEFSLEGRRVLDVQTIFHREEPRDLSAAARFYLGREHEDAHNALADIRTSAAVLGAQLQRYPHLPRDLGGLHTYCEEYAPLRSELDRWFGAGEEGLVFRRGRHRGQRLAEVAREAPDYLRWMLGAEDMDEEVLRAVREALAAVEAPSEAGEGATPEPPCPEAAGPPQGAAANGLPREASDQGEGNANE
ncbi:MAG TPA: exonuclease domain-containing protein, partial [Longimicrobiales bacterium]|nr:exonuclease domain-containing protein [Longimicrobiales bacterium]